MTNRWLTLSFVHLVGFFSKEQRCLSKREVSALNFFLEFFPHRKRDYDQQKTVTNECEVSHWVVLSSSFIEFKAETTSHQKHKEVLTSWFNSEPSESSVDEHSLALWVLIKTPLRKFEIFRFPPRFYRVNSPLNGGEDPLWSVRPFHSISMVKH